MLRSNRKLKVSCRRLAAFLTLLLVLPFCELRNSAEETVSVVTNRHPIAGHPIYVIAAPPQEKMPLRPLDIPIVSSRKTPSATQDSQIDLQLPFSMSADQAVRIGSALMDDGAFQMALPYFYEAQKQEPNSSEVLNGLAHCYYELKRDEKALALYKRVAAENTSLWRAHYDVGRIQLENGRFAEAVEALRNALKLNPDDPETISGLGVALTRNNESAEALPYLTRVADMKRYIPEDFYYLGDAYAHNGEWLKAADAFKKGADIRGIDANAYFYWATMLFNADKLDEAFDAYQKVKQLDLTARHVGASLYMAEIHRLRGNALEALGQYQVVLRQKPDDIWVLFQAGYICFKLDQLGQAKQLFKKLIEVEPKHAGAAANLAALEAQFNENRQRNHEKTPGITLRDVVQANPDSVEAHINLGAQLITEETYPEAVTVLERAVNLRSDSASAQYNLGLAQLKMADYEKAVTSNRKALELKPDWPDAYNNLGLAYAKLSRWEEAAGAYREAVRIVPDYAGAYYNLGIALLSSGQKRPAEQLVEKLKPLSWDLQARLGHEILKVERSATVVAVPTPIPALPLAAPTPTQESAPANPTENPPAEVECPGPIYRPSGVTQMASITGQLQVIYTGEALQNKIEGKIVLRAVLCGNGSVSDITVEESLPHGLTGRAIEAMRKMQFQPALLDSRPVSVMVKQAFACADRVCTAVVPR